MHDQGRQSTGPAVSDTVDTLSSTCSNGWPPTPAPMPTCSRRGGRPARALPVWENANDRGFIARHHVPGQGAFVSVSTAWARHLGKHRQSLPR